MTGTFVAALGGLVIGLVTNLLDLPIIVMAVLALTWGWYTRPILRHVGLGRWA